MDSRKVTLSLSLALAVAFFFISVATAAEKTPNAAAPAFCVGAGANRRLCEIMVKDGKTWQKAMKNALKVAIQVAQKNRFTNKDIMDQIAPTKLVTKDTQKTIEKGCKLAFEDGVLRNLKEGIQTLKTTDVKSLKKAIQMVSFEGCKSVIEKNGISVPAMVHEFIDAMAKTKQVLSSIAETAGKA